MPEQRFVYSAKILNAAYAARHFFNTVKVTAEENRFFPTKGHKVLNMRKNSVNIASEAEKFGIEVYSGSAALTNQCQKLLIAEIARNVADCF